MAGGATPGVELRNHPAKFSDPIMDEIRRGLAEHLEPGALILDPFAGVGRIHELYPEYQTIGVEIEPEWAAHSPRTFVGDATDLPGWWTETYDAIVTSPCYGNRMADSFESKDGSTRHTYHHYLGRRPSEGSAATLQWGDEYREFHSKAWLEADRVLKPGGLFVLNISDHIRNGRRARVTAWHVKALLDLGFELLEARPVRTRRQRHGANGQLRVEHEHVIYMKKGEK